MCPFPTPFFLSLLQPWLTIQLRWGRKSLNLEELCSPWHLFLGAWLSLCWVWLPGSLGLPCCLCSVSPWKHSEERLGQEQGRRNCCPGEKLREPVGYSHPGDSRDSSTGGQSDPSGRGVNLCRGVLIQGHDLGLGASQGSGCCLCPPLCPQLRQLI